MKYGVVSIVGKPNVGKSTLINNIFGKVMTISTHKPQTTRNMIELSYKDEDGLINFLDTPGLHNPKNKLDLFLNSEVKKSLKKSDFVLFLFDASRPFDDEDEECLKVLKDFHIENVFLVINKIDLIKDEQELESIKNQLESFFEFKKTYEISANKIEDTKKLLSFVKDSISLYEGSKEDILALEKTVDDEFFVSEIIREIIINNFKQEIPYSVAIKIEEFKYDAKANLLSIRYSIIVEKESQKPIIIGKGGSSIKKINIEVRNKLSEIYDCKLFTTSEVKVKKSWRNNDLQIKELGYKK